MLKSDRKPILSLTSGESQYSLSLKLGDGLGLPSPKLRDGLSFRPSNYGTVGLFVTQCEGFYDKPAFFPKKVEVYLIDKVSQNHIRISRRLEHNVSSLVPQNYGTV